MLNGEVVMQGRKIYITKFDKDRLEDFISVAAEFNDPDKQYLLDLQDELERAEIVRSDEVPPGVVTMHSRVVLRDLDTSEKMTYTLVFPKDADIGQGALSILAPVGTAILGYHEGDVIAWPVPSGQRRICIEKVLYQPERAGDFHL